MKKMLKYKGCLIFLLALLAVTVVLQASFILARTSANYEIKNAQEAIDSAGTKRESTNYQIADSGGQFAAGDPSNNYISSTNYRLYAGYINATYYPPTVSTANITVSGATGTGGAYIIGSPMKVEWDNSLSGDSNPWVTAGSVGCDFSNVGGSSQTMYDDGTTSGDSTSGDNIWTAQYTLVAGSVDVETTVSVTATTSDGSGSGNSSSITVDNIAPIITANGTLTITTDGAVAGVAGIGDKVTQSAVTLSAADGDSTTIDLTALTGQETLAAAVESTAVIAGSLDDAAKTFTITVTDNAGNTDTTASDAISVDNVAPTVTNTYITVTGASGTDGVFKNGDTQVYTWDDSATGDNNADTISTVTFDGSSFAAADSAKAASVSADIWTGTGLAMDAQDDTGNTITVTVVDNAGNSTGPITSSVSYTIDTNVPAIAETAISILAGATAKIGTVVDIAVAAPTDTGSVVFTSAAAGDVLYDLDDAVDVAFNDSATAPDVTASDNTWSGRFTVKDSTLVTGSADNAAYGIEATLTDDAGNTSTQTSSTNTINVDNIRPTGYTLSLTADTDSSADGFAPSTGYDDDTTIDFSVGSAPADAASYQYKLDTGAYGSWLASSTVQYTSQAEGSHTAYAKVKDDAGNEGSAVSATVVIDTTAPITGNITVPISTSYTSVPSLFQGEVGDNSAGSGVGADRAVFYIRNVTGTTSYYWNESDWLSTTAQWLSTTHSANTGSNTSFWQDNVTLPDWTDQESYFVKLKTVDKAGNVLTGGETSFYYATAGSIKVVSEKVDTLTDKLGLTGSETVASKIASEATSTRTAVTTAQTTITDDVATKATATQAKVTSETAAAVSTIKSKVTSTETALKEKVKLEAATRILNQESYVKQNDTLTVRYKTDSGLSPVISVYDANDTLRVSEQTMSESISGSGIYEYALKFIWGRGEHTIVCQETSKGTLDGINIEVISTDLEAISTTATTTMAQLANVDTDQIALLNTSIASIDTEIAKIVANINELAGLSTSVKELTHKITTTIYAELEIATEKLKKINEDQGIKIEKMYDLSEEQSTDVDYIKNKTLEIKALVELSQEILARESDEPIVKCWLESTPKK